MYTCYPSEIAYRSVDINTIINIFDMTVSDKLK